jgi:YD repeat-containing protein
LNDLSAELIYNLDGTSMITDGKGITSMHTYDGRHTLTLQTDTLGGATNKTFDYNFRPNSVIDALGNATAMTWSDNGANLTRLVDAAGNQTDLAYDTLNNLTSTTDSRGATTSYAYSGALLVSSTDALTNTTHYTYTTPADGVPAGLLKAVEDPQGNVTTYAYDSLGQRISTTDALNRSISYTYDNLGRLKTVDDQGRVDWTCYNAAGRATRAVKNASGDGSTPQTNPCDATNYVPSSNPDLDRISASSTIVQAMR